ncbi:methyl-accepting chemotaxis protein [Shewanella sp.]|uniref:methyl-accepting chemotaxis protein n=1 Tax=Shewanella sp. TaxID=50422 RepID=UPI0040547A57
MKIRSKIQLSILSALVIPALIISIVLSSKLKEEAHKQFVDVSSREIRQIENGIAILFKDIEDNVRFLANHPVATGNSAGMTSYADGAGGAMTPSRNGGNEAQMYQLFDMFAKSHEGLAYIYYANQDGGYVQWPEGSISANYDPRTRPFYQHAMDNDGITRTSAYFYATDNATIISTVTQVKDPSGNKIGVQGMDMSLKGLTEYIKQIRLGETGFLMLAESDGTLLVDSRRPDNNFKKLSDIQESAYQQLAKLDQGQTSVELDGKMYRVNVITSSKFGWKFIGLVTMDEILSTAHFLIYLMLVIEAIMLVIFIALSFWVSNLITRPIDDVKDMLKEVASGDGDLTCHIVSRSKNDETAELASAFNLFVGKIRELIIQVVDNAKHVTIMANEVASASDNLSVVTGEQNSQSQSIAAALNEISLTSGQIAQTISGADELSKQSKLEVDEGSGVISDVIRRMSRVATDMGGLTSTLEDLNKSSDEINEIISLITDIANMTNLLALNAAIESARAGEAGRGFAVVADEVRTLSVRTSKAATQVSELIKALQLQSNASCGQIEILNQEINASVEHGAQSLQILEKITLSSEKISQETAHVAHSMGEESNAIEEINQNIQNMALAINESTEDIARLKSVSQQLGKQAEELQSSVGRFKT